MSRINPPAEESNSKTSDREADHDDHSAYTRATNASSSRREDGNEARDDALRRELAKIQSVNRVVTQVIDSLEKSRANMNTVHTSVSSASTLLDTWTRILSQTEHNQRLLLNPEWKGATQDIEELENESMLRQQAEERKAAEEEMRREAIARAAEEEEQRKRATTPSGTRGTRGRGRGSSAPRAASTRGGVATSASQRRTTSASRAGSGIGRGVPPARGRARGT